MSRWASVLVALVCGFALTQPVEGTRAAWSDSASATVPESRAGTATAPVLGCESKLLSAGRTVFWSSSTTAVGTNAYSVRALGVSFPVEVRPGGGYQATISEGLLTGLLKWAPVEVVVTVLEGTGWATSTSLTLSRGTLGLGLVCPS